MSASQPANFNLQEFSDAGLLLFGGRIYTYTNGTTAQKTAYTDPAGTVPHTYTADGAGGQYIALNARGELPAPLYLAPGAYDITLKRADGSTVWTRRAEPTADNVLALSTSLLSTIGSSLIGFLQAGAGATLRTVQSKLRENISALDIGFVGDGDAATYMGTDNSAAMAVLVALVIDPDVIAQGGITVFFPSGVYCFDGDSAVFNRSGVSFIRITGNGNSTRFIFRKSSGFRFGSPGYDGTYETFHSRIVLEKLMVYCQPAEVAAGDTIGLSFINCAEVTLIDIHSHYANQGFYFKDTPLVTWERPQAINCNRGISLKKSRSHPDADLAVIEINKPTCSGNEIDVYIDGGRDIKINGGSLVSKQALQVRATGSGIEGDQVELVQLNGVFLDYQDLTTPTIQIGNPADTTFQIKKVELNSCYYASSAGMTKPLINCDSPLLISVEVSGGYCSEAVDKFLVIGSSCLPTLEIDINNIGANSCLTYRITDERSATQRTELFEHYPSLQLNPDFSYFPAGGYFPFGYDQQQAGSIARSTAAFVTGDCALTLSGDGNPNPPAAPIWYPQYGDVVVEPGTDLVIEWIVRAPTTAAKNTLIIATANTDGTGDASTVADPLLTSVVQEFSNGFKRLIHAYKVPNNKVVTSIRVQGAIGETIVNDYFMVYGPNKYRPSEMLYPGAAAHFADANFKIAKFRGQKSMKRRAGEADEIYMCRKDAAGTYSWQLIA